MGKNIFEDSINSMWLGNITNVRKVINSFSGNFVGDNHYNQRLGIWRVNALVVNKNMDENRIEKLIRKLNRLSVIPGRIFIYWDLIEINWVSNGLQVVSSREEYYKLLLEFARFLDDIDIEGVEINDGSFGDDAEIIESNSDININKNAKFDAECFGSKEIEVTDTRWM